MLIGQLCVTTGGNGIAHVLFDALRLPATP
jgi:hypothetical protein